MADFKGLIDKLKSLLAGNKDKVNEAVDKVGDVIDSKTGGKYSAVVDKVQDAAKSAVEKVNPAEGSQSPKDGDAQ
ncbi:antitoxin [Mycobacteroides immunogenum]|uniref:Kanamycin biosynthetic protein n=1 Tax=Mycobacteroides immunogenum TaxID=83262 RepID=A0A7V8RUF3_9MYCO|nr:antitoxin [Mycobacteroides immunogenum]AMT69812.1 kanamycin biosynthetic protein [Mycobacteroides immunogenum]ANO02863.1 kanamycin biosynthetic protein [Mycobacteroides immunogenum]KIU39191.1 kanamycin biosynthetic protein [Mycobacteroides immunogenum]KPG03126.1 kanamycin biosynthetic protein [Mycobacteroides immunogenum]KPG03839.1 kanamycin biosynthetic protein [Mycobacteroides immunogenum]